MTLYEELCPVLWGWEVVEQERDGLAICRLALEADMILVLDLPSQE